jgi:hypothetical protein
LTSVTGHTQEWISRANNALNTNPNIRKLISRFVQNTKTDVALEQIQSSDIPTICDIILNEYTKVGWPHIFGNYPTFQVATQLRSAIKAAIRDEFTIKKCIILYEGLELASFEAKFKLIKNLPSSPVVSPVNNQELYNLILQQVPSDSEPIQNPDGSWSVAQPKRFELTTNDISSNAVLALLTDKPKYLGFQCIVKGDELSFPEANFTIEASGISQFMQEVNSDGIAYTYRSESEYGLPMHFRIYFDTNSFVIGADQFKTNEDGLINVGHIIYGISSYMYARYLVGQKHLSHRDLSDREINHLKADLIQEKSL